MQLPEKRKPVRKNPKMLMIYSSPKSGKTTIVAQLPNSLILELEPGGADYVEGTILDISKPIELNQALDLIEAENKKLGKFKYDYLIIDTITKLDEWSEIVGTYTYMQKAMGKKFNRVTNEKNETVKLNHTDKRFETVHELPNGYGYQYSRTTMTDWYDRLQTLAPHVILLAHIKDKLIESRSGDTVEAIDINLTGKVKSIFASRVDAIGHFKREGSNGILNFNNEYKVVCGGRCSHLDGEIIVSEKTPEGIKTFWDRIYVK